MPTLGGDVFPFRALPLHRSLDPSFYWVLCFWQVQNLSLSLNAHIKAGEIAEDCSRKEKGVCCLASGH
ncbi:unnamed protein product [Caenorhabditis auriculariae]|uniref:Uncharacterized protein n=1 Tax=Caenorhabditis auriculariae TaxID=2777116 RepID=A0A8S1HPP8_9PELO|nr:unnamed protein product [Caenorhabditis auriculariae]